MNELNNQDLDQYFDLIQLRDEMLAKQETASELTSRLFGQAAENADTKLHELERTEVVREGLLNLGGGVIKIVNELYELREVAAAGLIGADAITTTQNSLKQHVESNPRVKRAVEFIVNTAFIAKLQTGNVLALSTNQPKNDEKAEEQSVVAKAEVSREPIKVKLTLRENAIRIGTNGRLVKTANTQGRVNQRDYSADRVAVLKTLVSNQGEMMDVQGLWTQAFGTAKEFDGRAMGQIKTWLDKLTYNKRPLIAHNGKRGNSSAYGITDYSVEIIEEQVVKARPRVVEEVQQEVDEPHLTQADQPSRKKRHSKVEQSVPVSKFPLSRYEASVFAEFLRINSDVLEHMDIPAIPDDLVDALNDLTTQADHQIAMREHGHIQELRRVVIEKMHKFFSDEDLVLETFVEMSERDDRRALFEYLTDIEGEDRWELLAKLIDAKRSVDVTVFTRRTGISVDDVKPVVIVHDENGSRNLLAPEKATKVRTISFGEYADQFGTDPAEILASSQPTRENASAAANDLEVETTEEAPLLPEDPSDIVPSPTLVDEEVPVKEAEVPARKARTPEWQKSFRQEVGEVISLLEAENLMIEEPQSTKALRVKSTSTIFGTRTAVKRLVEAGLVGGGDRKGARRQDPMLSAKEIILMKLFNTHRELLSRGKPSQKAAVRIVEDCVKSYFDAKNSEADSGK